MDITLQEIKKNDITLVTDYLKINTVFNGDGINKAWFFLIEQAELAEKRQEIIEEHQRQQDIAVNQFRQAQEEIQRLKKENTRYEYLLGESELSDKIQSICDHCKLTSGGREITIKDEEFGFLIEEANKSHRLQEENGRFKKALQVYAKESNYESRRRKVPGTAINGEKISASLIEIDKGQTAREALEGDVK
ncbi:hypothetical protein P8917_01100 [Bacillus atrophaeus]|uniref:hypothetical protein n=1 Tax=Bacillus atrophaeus TaxID=1452 RepID=UPI002282B875|nr:hypothetical protein [Bacillus atrophaeus]MCY8813642.1 hypothetical protein [Bacillus atrophaeus]MCY8820285.1 hypothetical protein [Bacillus atrophaeus]MCY8828591.1 hypothetical protein [Bacillus atrophaeus]MCY8832678.1 hypothetical protein [Bacillus atrophaeus]MEC0749788.1 hypothetical protein [Bacillus atrophaeus]